MDKDLSCIKEDDEEVAYTSSDMVDNINLHVKNIEAPSNVATSETSIRCYRKRPTKSRGAPMVIRGDAAPHQTVSITNERPKKRDKKDTKRVSFSTSDTYLNADGDSYTPIRLSSDP